MLRRASLVFLVAIPSFLALTYCTGEDPKSLEGCYDDKGCTPNETCEVSTGKCRPRVDVGSDAEVDGGPDGPKPIVLGQPDEYSVIENELGMGQPNGLSIANGRLFVGDYNHFRVLVWNKIPTQSFVRAEVVVGQPDLKTGNEQTISDKSLYTGYYCGNPVAATNDRLFVSEASRHRTMIWNAIPQSSYAAANVVLGQVGFTQIGIDGGALPAAATTEANPCGVATDGTRLFVADLTNHRVLGWNTIPTSNNVPADFVLGQANFSDATDRCDGKPLTKDCLRFPSSIVHDGSGLWVSDSGHSRILKWRDPIGSSTPADIEIGRPGGASAPAFATPRGIHAANNKLFVADQENNRVLIWAPIPDADDVPANVVVGQPDMISVAPWHGSTGPDDKSILGPTSVVSDGTRLVVADAKSNRTLIWNDVPSANLAPANIVLGMPTMTARDVQPPTATRFNIGAAFTDGKTFMIGEMSRILLWDHIPTGPNDAATRVLGQDDLVTRTPAPANPTAPPPWNETRFHIIQGLWSDATKLVAVDTFFHRVLIWNKPITQNHQPADLFLGQNSATGVGQNKPSGTPTASNVSFPAGVISDGTRLALADGNSRVLIWNTFPTTTGQPADLVLGQSTFDTSFVNGPTGVASASTMSRPSSLAWDGSHFFVVDRGNHRVLMWNGWPTKTAQPADLVIGQPDFTGTAANNGGRSATSLDTPSGITILDGKLYVGDSGNERVLRFDVIPGANHPAANGVYGQKAFDTAEPNQGGVGPRSLASPGVSVASPGRIWINDSANHRLVGLPIP